MRSKTIFGALLVSVALCSQGFGFGLLDNVLGLNNGGCCGCCEKACCEPACCEKPCCEPCCDLFGGLKGLLSCKSCGCCEPACCEEACCEPACCEEACCEPACCESCCKPCCDLFGGLKGLLSCKSCGCCEPACCEEACCEKACCEPKCCEETCCEPRCRKQRCITVRLPNLGLLDAIGDLLCCKKSCCCESCCDACGNGVPAAAPAEEAAPLPPAPKADDPTASLNRGNIRNVSRTIIQ